MSPRRLVHLLIVGCALVLVVPGALAAEADQPAEAQAAENGDEAAPESAEEAGSAGPVGPSLDGPRPPVGVRMGEALEGRRLRVGYSWERIRYQGLATGTKDLTPDYVRDTLGYSSTLRSLEVTVHTVELAYAPHPRVTLVVELPFVKKEIERLDFATAGPCNGVRCQHQADGVGDVRFAMIVPFIRKGVESSQVHVGFDAPTGSIRRQGGTALRLPYLAQVGNGTWDFEWGWTYKGELDWIAWGGQALGHHPIARNGLDYRQGSRFTGRIWLALRLFAGIDLSLRGEWEKQNEIEGFDRSLRPTVDPAENPELYERSTLRLAPGLSLPVPVLPGQRVGVEVAVPVYQDLDGPQLEERWGVRVAWRWVY